MIVMPIRRMRSSCVTKSCRSIDAPLGRFVRKCEPVLERGYQAHAPCQTIAQVLDNVFNEPRHDCVPCRLGRREDLDRMARAEQRQQMAASKLSAELAYAR